MKWKKALILVMLPAVIAVGFAGCIGGKEETNKKEASSSVLKVGTNATYVPFEFIEEKNGTKDYSGFDMDLSREIGKRLGMKVEIHNIPFDGLIPAINSGEIDMIASGMVITEERKERVDFIPYYDSGLGILVADTINDVKSVDDLKGKKIAVQMGTTGSVAAHKIPNAVIREFDHNSEALLELKQKGADAVITAIPVGKHYLKTTADSNAKMVEEPIQKQTMGLAFSKEKKELYAKVQKALEEIKADGTYQTLQKKWIE